MEVSVISAGPDEAFLALLPVIADLVTAGAAVGAFIIAYRGLRVWKDELQARTKFELARRILRAVYEARDGFRVVRNSAMWGWEMPDLAPEELEKLSFDEVQFKKRASAYQARWEKLSAPISRLQSELIELEVIEGSLSRKGFDDLFNLQSKLFRALRDHLRLNDPKVSESEKKVIMNRWANNEDRLDDVIFDGEDETDQFAKDIDVAISEAEKSLRHHIDGAMRGNQ